MGPSLYDLSFISKSRRAPKYTPRLCKYPSISLIYIASMIETSTKIERKNDFNPNPKTQRETDLGTDQE